MSVVPFPKNTPKPIVASASEDVQAVYLPYSQALQKSMESPTPITSSDTLSQYRQRAKARFQEEGFPTRKHEAWKYVNLKPLLHEPYAPYAPASEPTAGSLVLEQLRAFLVFGTAQAAYRLVFINGTFQPAFSSLPEGTQYTCMPLTEAISNPQTAPSVEEICVRLDAFYQNRAHMPASQERSLYDAFEAINAAQVGTAPTSGFFLNVPKGQQVDKTIEVLFCTTGDPEQPRATYPRLVINLEDGSSVKLVTQFVSHHPGYHTTPHTLTNAVMEGVIGTGATFNHTVIYRDGTAGISFDHSRFLVEANASVNWFWAALDGDMIRNHLQCDILGEGATVKVQGLNILNRETRCHNHVEMVHHVSNSESHQTVKGILQGNSRSDFDGVIRIYPGADQTEARQLNKNLLRSRQAQVYTRPWLWIDTDDVQCSHGATVGQLNADELFYMQSRGLDQEVSECFLTFGFAEDLITSIQEHAVRRYLERRVLESLGQSDNPNDCWMSCEWKTR